MPSCVHIFVGNFHGNKLAAGYCRVSVVHMECKKVHTVKIPHIWDMGSVSMLLIPASWLLHMLLFLPKIKSRVTSEEPFHFYVFFHEEESEASVNKCYSWIFKSTNICSKRRQGGKGSSNQIASYKFSFPFWFFGRQKESFNPVDITSGRLISDMDLVDSYLIMSH